MRLCNWPRSLVPWHMANKRAATVSRLWLALRGMRRSSHTASSMQPSSTRSSSSKTRHSAGRCVVSIPAIPSRKRGPRSLPMKRCRPPARGSAPESRGAVLIPIFSTLARRFPAGSGCETARAAARRTFEGRSRDGKRNSMKPWTAGLRSGPLNGSPLEPKTLRQSCKEPAWEAQFRARDASRSTSLFESSQQLWLRLIRLRLSPPSSKRRPARHP